MAVLHLVEERGQQATAPPEGLLGYESGEEHVVSRGFGFSSSDGPAEDHGFVHGFGLVRVLLALLAVVALVGGVACGVPDMAYWITAWRKLASPARTPAVRMIEEITLAKYDVRLEHQARQQFLNAS